MRWFNKALILSGIALGAVTPAAAAVDVFLKFDGVPGESVSHPGWIEVSSFRWGVGRGISSPMGASADRESSAPSVSEITVTKAVDKASPMLGKCAQTGCHFPKVLLEMRKAGGGPDNQYVLSNVTISGRSMSSGGDRPMESVSLNFTKIEMRNQAASGPRQTLPMDSSPSTHGRMAAPSKGLPPPGHTGSH